VAASSVEEDNVVDIQEEDVHNKDLAQAAARSSPVEGELRMRQVAACPDGPDGVALAFHASAGASCGEVEDPCEEAASIHVEAGHAIQEDPCRAVACQVEVRQQPNLQAGQVHCPSW